MLITVRKITLWFEENGWIIGDNGILGRDDLHRRGNFRSVKDLGGVCGKGGGRRHIGKVSGFAGGMGGCAGTVFGLQGDAHALRKPVKGQGDAPRRKLQRVAAAQAERLPDAFRGEVVNRQVQGTHRFVGGVVEDGAARVGAERPADVFLLRGQLRLARPHGGACVCSPEQAERRSSKKGPGQETEQGAFS